MTDATHITLSQNYTGHVTPDGPATIRTVSTWNGDSMSIIKFSVNPMDNNVYLITCLDTRQSILVDAANDADRIIALLNLYPTEVQEIITTHQHGDHWQALEKVASTLGVPTAAGEFDAHAIIQAGGGPIDRLIEDGESFLVGKLVVEPLLLRGHTPGGIALSITVDGQTHLFSGDSLFPGGLGKTTQERDFITLIADVETKIFDRYLDSTIIYPGHGDDTTLETERPHLGEWKARGW